MPSRAACAKWVTAAGDVLVAWALLIAVENVAVGLGWRALFAGSWEMAIARTCVSPIAIAALAPAALVMPLLGEGLARAAVSRNARRPVAALAAALGALEGWGVTFGRHFASWGVRAPFIAALAAVAGISSWMLAPRMVGAARAHPRIAGACGAALAALAWAADSLVLPRLYPAFHAALVLIALAASALLPLAWRGPRASPAVPVHAWGALAVAAASAAWAPRAAARLHAADNLRLVLVEHAPILGRTVRLAALISPPPAEDDDLAAASPSAPADAPARALDWAGRDILLVTIDALRADHTSVAGYARETTPNLARLMGEGTTFAHAYCPTPHTSYSVASLMTGKYMRPLLALGAGSDSETWASYARRYGYRTAAFYPPAVFFIDEQRFTALRDRGLDFEYRKVEFATPAARARQVREYLANVPRGTPLFLWVHLFEPHEPYVMHPEHPFGPASGWTDVDAYDSEIAAADAGLGEIVDAMRRARPDPVVVVTADHGEEFGEHGGRYHGTTVYEEQVRVPLVVVGAGVAAGARATAVVQTIDLLPTALSALGMPKPPRLRGRDLGPVLTHAAEGGDGLAFAETDDYTLVARAMHRLVCARKAAACSLYDVGDDAGETRDRASERPDVARELRKTTRAIERDSARFEAAEANDLPEALRRGMLGEAEAAVDVAALLDDARVDVRRRAASVLFELHVADTAPQLKRALARDEDDVVRRFAAIALVRVGGPSSPLAEALVADPQIDWRRRAALAFAERGDARGEAELVAWWSSWSSMPFESARELLAAIARIKAKSAAPALASALDDVRLRPDIADALGALGDVRAKRTLLDAFTHERYVSARPHEARALVRMGARGELEGPLARFAGLPQPMPDALALARDAGLLVPERGGWAGAAPAPVLDVKVRAKRGPSRLLVLSSRDVSDTHGTVGGAPVAFAHDGALRVADVDAEGGSTPLHLEDDAGLVAAWLVPRSEELPPPPPAPWSPAGQP